MGLARTGLAGIPQAVAGPLPTAARGAVRVLVQKLAARDLGPERTVARLGGRVTRELPIVGGLAASSPSTPRSVYPQVVRADAAWKAGATGSGVTVAIVDTGVSDVPDLHGRRVQVTDDLT